MIFTLVMFHILEPSEMSLLVHSISTETYIIDIYYLLDFRPQAVNLTRNILSIHD